MIIKTVLQIIAVIVSVGAFLPLVRCDSWMVRGWDFPKIQLFVVGLLALVGLSFFAISGSGGGWDWVVIGVLVLALIALVKWIWRYTRLHPKEVLDGVGETTIRFLVSNVLMSNRESAKLISLVREKQPDIFIALETDQWWTDKISELADEYPHAVELPQEDTYGMLLRSRIPLIDPSVEYIVRDNIPSIHMDVRLKDGTLVHLHAVHPKPPFPDEDTTSTDRDAELLIVGKRVEELRGPSIVLGDLNDVAWSGTTHLFQKTSRLLDPRVGRGLFNTFHAGHWFLRWPLDHIFISDHFRVKHLDRLPNVGSDHFPIFAEFSFEPDGTGDQEAPEKGPSDDAEADEKIAAAEDKNHSE